MTSPIQSIYNWYRQAIANPKYRWWIIGGTLLYLLSPIDIAPDFIPFIGQIDDAILVTLLVSELAQLLGDRLSSAKKKGAASADSTRAESTVADDVVDVHAMPE